MDNGETPVGMVFNSIQQLAKRSFGTEPVHHQTILQVYWIMCNLLMMSNMYNLKKNLAKQLWVIYMKSLTLYKHCWWKELLGVIVAMIMTIGMIDEKRQKRLMLQCEGRSELLSDHCKVIFQSTRSSNCCWGSVHWHGVSYRRGNCNVCVKQSIKDNFNALLMMACPSLLAPVHSDLPLLVLRAAKISPSVHPPHVSLSLSVGDGLSAKRAVRLIHFRICPIQAKKAHNCYPCNTTKKCLLNKTKNVNKSVWQLSAKSPDEIKIFAISILMIQQVWRCQGGKIGITLNINWMEPRDPSDEADVEASEESLALIFS